VRLVGASGILTFGQHWPRSGNRVKYLGQLGLVSATYFVSAKAGLEFAFANQSVTSIWPPTGLALAVVVIWGYRMWPAVAAGAFLANITTAGPLLTVLGIATGNTLEALVGAFLLHRLACFRPSLERTRDVLALVFYGAIVSTTISATIGVASLSASGLVPGGETLSTWRVWWLGDSGGDLLVAPALLVLASGTALEWRRWIRTEAVALLMVAAGVAMLAFTTSQQLAYIMFPILFWIAYRFRQSGAVVAGLIISGIAVWLTARGEGPFVGGSADAELLRAQTFVGVATITGLVAAALITERSRVEQRLLYLADHDTLTGLLNRRGFTQELEKWVAYRSRYGGRGAVLVVDVDHFKSVNDILGHPVGDELIARLGGLLRNRLRETDIVARWGGDEFTVLLPAADQEQALGAATALLEEVRREGTLTDGDLTMQVTLSIGVSPFGEGVDLDAERVLASADFAMYRAKNAGRNQVHLEHMTERPQSQVNPQPDGSGHLHAVTHDD
jgi:diguanylate cyclase (GGDEF)-like protein